MSEAPDPNRVYIDELSRILDRSDKTIRSWVRDAAEAYAMADEILDRVPAGTKIKANEIVPKGLLPSWLLPKKEEGRKKLFWDRAQLEGLKEFSEKKNSRRGWDGVRAQARA